MIDAGQRYHLLDQPKKSLDGEYVLKAFLEGRKVLKGGLSVRAQVDRQLCSVQEARQSDRDR